METRETECFYHPITASDVIEGSFMSFDGAFFASPLSTGIFEGKVECVISVIKKALTEEEEVEEVLYTSTSKYQDIFMLEVK